VRDAKGRVVESTRDEEHKLLHVDLPQLATNGSLCAVRIKVQDARNLLSHMLDTLACDPALKSGEGPRARQRARRRRGQHVRSGAAARSDSLQERSSGATKQARPIQMRHHERNSIQATAPREALKQSDICIASNTSISRCELSAEVQGCRTGSQWDASEGSTQHTGAHSETHRALTRLQDEGVRVVVSKAPNGKFFCVVESSSRGDDLLIVDVTALIYAAQQGLGQHVSLVGPVVFSAASFVQDEQCAPSLTTHVPQSP
jgi:hypothetical protein